MRFLDGPDESPDDRAAGPAAAGGSPTVVFTDGACLGNPGPGGWAWAEPGGRYRSGAAEHTTNQRMELTAALEAVRAHPGPLVVVSDSTYVVNCFRDGWWQGWRRRGWVNSKKEPVANRDLWEPLVDLVVGRGDVTFRWVKGHGGDVDNDLVDRLAVEAARTQRGREGTGTPEVLGAPDTAPAAGGPGDEPAGAPAARQRDARLPAGRLVLVAGHRPPEIGGWDPNPQADRVRRRLAEALAGLVEVDGALTVVSGLRLGAEQLGAEAAVEAGIPFVAVLPYPEPDAPWPPASRARFAELLEQAAGVVTLDRKAPRSKQAAGLALRRRDDWFARQVDTAIVVWDQQDAAVGRTVRTLEQQLGPDQVLIVAP